MTDPIDLVGMKELRKSLRRVNKDLPKEVRPALNEAADILVQDVRPRVPRRGGKAQRSVRAASSGSKARVKAGNRRAPYYAWLDFGGAVGKSGSVRRPYKKKGRYLFKRYDALADRGEFRDVLSDRLTKVAERAGLKVS